MQLKSINEIAHWQESKGKTLRYTLNSEKLQYLTSKNINPSVVTSKERSLTKKFDVSAEKIVYKDNSAMAGKKIEINH